MYESYYGLSEPPFELTANPKYIYLSARQREALSMLQYGLFSAKSLTLLVGDAGMGKTTLIQAALASERCQNVRAVYLNNPTLRPDDFIRLLARKLNLGAEAGESKALLVEQLDAVLRERRAAGITTALVVDEAQSLSIEMLEEIRLLANIETPEAKLLPVVLAIRQWGEDWGYGEMDIVLADSKNRRPVKRIRVLAEDGRELALGDMTWVCRDEIKGKADKAA